MRTFSTALLLAALVLLPLVARGQTTDMMTVEDIAFDESGATIAVRVEAGILLHDASDEVTFLCASAWETAGAEAQWLFQTGPGRPLLTGAQGPFLALESGCEWARISGPADSAKVVGVHAIEPGGDALLFAVSSGFGPDEILRTDDGGFTSASAGGFAQLDKNLTGLVGDGDTVVVSGVGVVSSAWVAWVSEDAGESFAALDLDTEEGGELIGLGGQTLWLGEGANLSAYDLQTGAQVMTLQPEGASVAHMVTPDGALWWAESGGRLRYEDPHSGSGESYDIAVTALAQQGESTWVGLQAEQPGDPLLMRLDSGAESWSVARHRPSVWSYPEGCQTLQAQQCADDSALLLPHEVDDPDPEPVASTSPDGGCSGTSGASGFPLELYIFLMLGFAVRLLRASSRNGSRSASP